MLTPTLKFRVSSLLVALAAFHFAPPAVNGEGLHLPPAATEGLQRLYSGDPDAAMAEFQKIQMEQPDHPLGYLLEGEALWWKIYCSSAEFKWGMTDAWHRDKRAEDQNYFDLARKANALAEAELKKRDSPEMHFYAGMGEALVARLYGLRWENRAAARAGVRARDHFARALALDPTLADADLGLGLYNYYVDTLSTLAKILRFFMGIPGGSKKAGIRQLEHAIAQGTLTQAESRFYLAKNLRNYDRDYQHALIVLEPLVLQYPSNALFQLLRGDLYAKLDRKEQAAQCFRAAAALSVSDPRCRERIQGLVRDSLAALGPAASSSAGAPGN